MEIVIEKLEVAGSQLIIHFKDEVTRREGHGSAYMTRIGTKALRILYMHMGKVPFFSSTKQPRQISFDRRHANRHTNTAKALQAIMDQHANTRLQVANFRQVTVLGGNSKVLKTVADIKKLWDEDPMATVIASRQIRLNMPTDSNDGIQLGRVLKDIDCSSYHILRWGSIKSLDIDVLELALYFDASYGSVDPWTLMKSLEPKIKREMYEWTKP